MRTFLKVGGLALAALCVVSLSFSGGGRSSGPVAPAQGTPELVLYLAGSSSNPFSDLSAYHHPVNLISNELGGNVQLVHDAELGRLVYSFEAGGWLEIPDINQLFTAYSTDELTIEICAKALDPGGPAYFCGDVSGPILQPVPDQMLLYKGGFSGDRNYYMNFAWSRDDLRKEYCDPVGYFPSYCFDLGPTTEGFYGPPDPSLVPGWKVFAFRFTQEVTQIPGPNPPEFGKTVYCHTNRNDNPYPAAYVAANLDSYAAAAADDPLLIGNGVPTNGTNCFVPNPFKGRISYIRIYRGLLPFEELNDNPANLPALPPSNQPPVAICQDITVNADANCQASITPAMVNNGSYDPDGDSFSLYIDNVGPFTPGTHTVNLTISENTPAGLSSSCQAHVTVVDVTAPVPTVSDPVCTPDGKGKTANVIAVTAADACGGEASVQVSNVNVFNNGGQQVNGKGTFTLVGNTLYVYPNGNGWSVTLTVTASDTAGNKSDPQTFRKTLNKCR